MKYARIVDNTVVETIEWNPEGRYPEDWVWVECPDNVAQHWIYDGENFAPPEGVTPNPDPEPAPEPEVPKRFLVSPIEFKMAFTSTERLTIKALRGYEGDDAQSNQIKDVLDDWFDILNDARLDTVNLQLPGTIEGLEFLVMINVLTDERKDEILAGLPV